MPTKQDYEERAYARFFAMARESDAMATLDEIIEAIDFGVRYGLEARGIEDVSVEVQHAERNVIRIVFVQGNQITPRSQNDD